MLIGDSDSVLANGICQVSQMDTVPFCISLDLFVPTNGAIITTTQTLTLQAASHYFSCTEAAHNSPECLVPHSNRFECETGLRRIQSLSF